MEIKTGGKVGADGDGDRRERTRLQLRAGEVNNVLELREIASRSRSRSLLRRLPLGSNVQS